MRVVDPQTPFRSLSCGFWDGVFHNRGPLIFVFTPNGSQITAWIIQHAGLNSFHSTALQHEGHRLEIDCSHLQQVPTGAITPDAISSAFTPLCRHGRPVSFTPSKPERLGDLWTIEEMCANANLLQPPCSDVALMTAKITNVHSIYMMSLKAIESIYIAKLPNKDFFGGGGLGCVSSLLSKWRFVLIPRVLILLSPSAALPPLSGPFFHIAIYLTGFW